MAKEGIGPEREFSWRARVSSRVRVPSSEGRVPERFRLINLITVTWLPSQLTFVHVQQSVVLDQPLGAVLKEARSLAMTAASSADERVRKEKMKVEK